MIAGFAMIAVPAEHGTTGIMSFIVSHQGRVLQRDLGDAGDLVGTAIEVYDPNPSWTPVELEE